ncbi:hypothetical protein ACFL2V_13645 [Pseudomonadota bacterium]
MNFYIQRWPDDSATLMLDNGISVATYHSMDKAVEVYEEWQRYHMPNDNVAAQDKAPSSPFYG